MKISLVNGRNGIPAGVCILAVMALFLLLGANYRQLYSALVVRNETGRLENLALEAPEEFQNPPPAADRFDGELSSDFWEFILINGAGQASNGITWHSSAVTFDQSMEIRHFSDPAFHAESDVWHRPGADQYNNVSLIGGSGFRPSSSSDVVLRFTAHVNEGFYGTAGVVFQPVDTIEKNGWIMKPFDMFGFSMVGEESSVNGVNGPLCYLALNWVPAQLKPLEVNLQDPHTYEIRLHWINRTEWLGTLSVDERVQCQIEMPPFGPVEIHVWSDNYLLLSQPRRWWEFGPTMDLKFQDGGEKQFNLGDIEIFEVER
jgi:hypothetical protein